MRKILVPALVLVLFLTLFLGASASDKRPIIITCPDTPGNPAINPDTLVICPQDWATFTATLAGEDGCGDSVRISGPAPIGILSLTPATPQRSVEFSSTGVYVYSATRYTGGTAQGSSQGAVTVTAVGCPTVTQWGIVILVALILGSGVFVMLRRRKATVVA